jgi:dolichol-phosphate mannosyltransferase
MVSLGERMFTPRNHAARTGAPPSCAVAVAPAADPDPSNRPAISVVVPAFNESANVPALLDLLVPILDGIGSFEILFVDDGSTDDTVEVVRRNRALDARVGLVALSRNFGHQTALRAGLAHARGECVVSMDADLQHPPALIAELVAKWREGYDVVYTIRRDPATLAPAKRATSALFYRVLNALSGVRVEPGAADFRLLSRRVLTLLNDLDEQPFFLRGLVPWLGFRQIGIPYTPADRRHGTSKYTLRKMVGLAVDGITSFSVKPLLVSTGLAALTGALALAYSCYAIYTRVFTHAAVPGWTSVLVAVLWLGSMQLFVLGIIGQYLGKLFLQAKRRPAYIVKDVER